MAYVCRPCKTAGTKTPAVKRVVLRERDTAAIKAFDVKAGSAVALCEKHAKAYDAAKGDEGAGKALLAATTTKIRKKAASGG
jgi:hypothetical protein